jgi:unsaturated rhamnogalacturonyl hydrolase
VRALHRTFITSLGALLLCAGCSEPEVEPTLRTGTACPATVMREVNDRWHATHPRPGNNKWARAVYYTGEIAAYESLGERRYLDHALAWAESHRWRIHGGTGTHNADNHAAAQVYLALHAVEPEPERIAATTAAIDTIVDSGDRDDWSWIDAQFMASPVFAELGALTDDPRYVDAMFALYLDAKERRGLHDAAAGLWYRDESYLFPGAKTSGGEKIFWSRGNGWVMAGLVRSLAFLPPDGPEAAEYAAMLEQMSAALVPLQRPDGFWGVSLHDPDDFAGPETSGTAFFTYAMAWGIRHGYLDEGTYLPVVERAWRAMVAGALQADGTVGYIQGVGEAPDSSQPVTLSSNADFGVGALLLAGSEVRWLPLDLDCP